MGIEKDLGEGYRVVVTGATGLIGGRVTEILLERGARVTVFARNTKGSRALFGDRVEHGEWDFEHPDRGDWKPRLVRAGAIVHLAGTPLFAERWTPEFKRKMEESRTQSTRQLVACLASEGARPEAFVCASAVGIYGTDPSVDADERAPAADDILARICVAWEAEASRAEQTGARAVQVRTGIVLSPKAGALKQMLPLFRLGLGGVLGRRDPWINWIHLEDIARIHVKALLDPEVSGPVNAVAPSPCRNADFGRTLARVLGRPFVGRYPEALLRVGVGEAARFVSGGARVSARLVQDKGYSFLFAELEPALRDLLR